MARVVPKRVLEDIRFRSDIVDVVGSYLTLKRAGATFKACCPFHKEKTPSFIVNPQRQIFHCFGCGAGGDVFGFVEKHEGVDFVGAIKILAQRAGVRLELEDGDGGPGSDKEVLYRIHAEIAAFYQRCLLTMSSAATARAYLEKRDLGKEALDEFLIGYAPNRWDAAIQWGRKKKYTTEQLEQAGLIVKKEGAEVRYYDRFRNRIVFPIFDAQSRPIGFSARTLEAKADVAKYVNSPETPIFQKSRVLYALDKARRHIVSGDTREAIVCEGQIDCIRCHLAGFGQTVASQGTAFTDDHARLLRRFADSAVLVFDPDRAGQDAAIRTVGIFMEAGLAVRVASLPSGDDPDSFIRKNGPEAFREILGRAQSAVGFQIDVLSAREKMDSEVGLMRVARAVLEGIGRSPNAVQRAKLLQLAAERLRLPVSALEDDLRRMQPSRRRRMEAESAEPQDAAEPEEDALPREEVELCEHLAHAAADADIAALLKHYLPPEKLTSSLCRRFAEAARQAAETRREIVDVLRDDADPDPRLQAFAAQVQSAPVKVKTEFSRADAVKGLILCIWRRAFDRERTALANSPDTAAAERRSQITHHLNRLKTWDDGAPIILFEMGG